MGFEQRGQVPFPVDGVSRVYEFKVTATDEELQIWLEDSVTKEQWQTIDLRLTDFVTLATAIPQARTPDYAARIVQCLVPTSDADKPTRSLSRASSDGSRVLCVGFTLNALAFTTLLEYSFTLNTVLIEPTELLNTRMRDMEDAVASLKVENAKLQGELSVLRAASSTTTAQGVELASIRAELDSLRKEISESKASSASANSSVVSSISTLRNLITTIRQATKAQAAFHSDAQLNGNRAFKWLPSGQFDAALFATKDDTQIEVFKSGVYLVFLTIMHEKDVGHLATIIDVRLDGTSVGSYFNEDTPQFSDQSTLSIRVIISRRGKLEIFYTGDILGLQKTGIVLMEV